MDENQIRSMMEKLEERKTTEELLQALKDNDHEQWTEEGFEAIRRVLKNKQVDISGFSARHGATDNAYFDIRFRTHIKSGKVTCPYVGRGRLGLMEEGIKVFGKTAFSKREKVIIGAGIVIFSLILQQMLGFNKIYIPSIWLLYFLLDVVILKQNDRTIPWGKVSFVRKDPIDEFIAIEYISIGDASTAPSVKSVVFKSDSFEAVLSDLEKRGKLPITSIT